MKVTIDIIKTDQKTDRTIRGVKIHALNLLSVFASSKKVSQGEALSEILERFFGVHDKKIEK